MLFVSVESRCVKHYKIYKRSNSCYYLKEKVTFRNIDDLIEFYTSNYFQIIYIFSSKNRISFTQPNFKFRETDI